MRAYIERNPINVLLALVCINAANFVFTASHTEPRSISAFIGMCASFMTLFPAKIAVDSVFEGKGKKDAE